jgi:trans-aconitate methyltransferase
VLRGGQGVAPGGGDAQSGGLDVEIVGVDLVGMFHRAAPGTTRLRLIESSLTSWRPDRAFDLITCVHGLHYIGDKLGLITRACSRLAEDGLFVASLDPANLKLADGRAADRATIAALRRACVRYDRRKRLVVCRGRRAVVPPLRYLGADDRAGPNSTGQPAVDSYYEQLSNR